MHEECSRFACVSAKERLTRPAGRDGRSACSLFVHCPTNNSVNTEKLKKCLQCVCPRKGDSPCRTSSRACAANCYGNIIGSSFLACFAFTNSAPQDEFPGVHLDSIDPDITARVAGVFNKPPCDCDEDDK